MKVIPSVLVGGLAGAAGDVVAATWKGRLYVRRRVIPYNPKSDAQMAQRGALTRMVDCFQPLGAAIKTFLDKLGADFAISGYNRYTQANIKGEKADFYHPIIPSNRYASDLTGLVVATGAVAAGDIDITWDAGDYVATDPINLYVRKVTEEAGEYETPWTLVDTTATFMDDEAFTIEDLDPATDYAVAMFPTNVALGFYGAGMAGHAVSKAA